MIITTWLVVSKKQQLVIVSSSSSSELVVDPTLRIVGSVNLQIRDTYCSSWLFLSCLLYLFVLFLSHSRAEDHLNMKDPPSTEYSAPYCDSSLDFSMYAFEHLEVFIYVILLSITDCICLFLTNRNETTGKSILLDSFQTTTISKF